MPHQGTGKSRNLWHFTHFMLNHNDCSLENNRKDKLGPDLFSGFLEKYQLYSTLSGYGRLLRTEQKSHFSHFLSFQIHLSNRPAALVIYLSVNGEIKMCITREGKACSGERGDNCAPYQDDATRLNIVDHFVALTFSKIAFFDRQRQP